jgi:tryptophan-rich sensory protein
MKNIWKLIISFVVTFAAASVGSLATFKAIPTWYASLNRTIISPPNWLFGPAWTILYILMAVAAFLVWREGLEKKNVKEGLQLFIAQLVLNALWSIIFFGYHLIFTAFIEIILLLILIILTTVWFYRVKKLAAYLMMPYIAWVSFASILNFATWLVNK